MFDHDEPEKQQRAQALFQEHSESGRLVLSAQVMQEFYVTVTRKLAAPLPAEQAEEVVSNFALLPVVQTDPRLIMDAIAISRRHMLSLWDALILRAARSAACAYLLTEDLQHGFALDGVEIVNPFVNQ